MLDTERSHPLEDVATEAFDLAARNSVTIDRAVRLAGRVIRFRFAGPALVDPLTRAFRHLPEASPEEPDLTVRIWDAASTGTGAPPVASPPPGATHSAMYLHRTTRARGLEQPVEGVLSIVAPEGDDAWYWVRDGAALPFYELAGPIRHILAGWLGPRGCTIVHAGAVGTDRGGVLLLGRGGSGKSTAALACLGSSIRYAADDYVLVEGGRALALYSTGKLHADSLSLLPHLRALVDNLDRVPQEKAVLYLEERWPEALTPGFPIVAVAACRIGGGERARLQPITPAAALGAAAPSTIIQFPGRGQETLDAMAELMAGVPAFSLDLPRDPARLPAALEDLLDRVDGR